MTQLLTARELASLLSLKEQTIYNRHSTGGNLPAAIKIGSRLRFRLSDVEAWIAGQMEPHPAPSMLCRASTDQALARGRPNTAQQIASCILEVKPLSQNTDNN